MHDDDYPANNQHHRQQSQQQLAVETTELIDGHDRASSASSSTLFPEPPDGGYGWVVVFASFLIHFIADGISFSFGIMYPEIQNYFGSSKGASAVAGSLFLALPLLAGPIASALTDRYDCRRTTIAGGLLAAIGFFGSRFVTELWMLLFTFGLISGLGLSLVFNSAIIAVTYYFEGRRALATGIAVSGSGIGTFFFAPLIELMQLNYGWKGSILILSGVLLNLVVCGVLIKDLEWPMDTLEYKRNRFIRTMERESNRSLHGMPQQQQQQQQSYDANDLIECGDTIAARRRRNSLQEMPTYLRADADKYEMNSVEEDHEPALIDFHRISSGDASNRSKSIAVLMPIDDTERVKNLDHLDLHVILQSSTSPMNKRRERYVSNTSRSLDDLHDHETISQPIAGSSWNGDQQSMSAASHPDKQDKDKNMKKNQLQQQPIIYCDGATSSPSSNQIIDVAPPLPNTTTTVIGRSLSTHHHHHRPTARVVSWRTAQPLDVGFNRLAIRVPSAPALFYKRRKIRRPGAIRCRKIWEAVSDTVCSDIELFKSFSFVLFLLSTLLLYTFYDIPYVNLPEYAVADVHITENQSSLLVSIIGIVNTIGMLSFGILADWPVTNKHKLKAYSMSTLISGVCVLIIPWLTSFWMLAVACALFGFFISANYVLSSVIIIDLLSLSDFANAYGILCLIEGSGTLFGPTIAGYLHDITGSYFFTFVIGGVGIIIAGLLTFVIDLYRCICKNSSKNFTKTTILSSKSGSDATIAQTTTG